MPGCVNAAKRFDVVVHSFAAILRSRLWSELSQLRQELSLVPFGTLSASSICLRCAPICFGAGELAAFPSFANGGRFRAILLAYSATCCIHRFERSGAAPRGPRCASSVPARPSRHRRPQDNWV